MYSGEKKIVNAGDLSASFNSSGVNVEKFSIFSIQGVWSASGSPSGTLKLQCSNDPGTDVAHSDAGVTNWTDIANSSNVLASAADGTIVWNMGTVGFKWIRLSWTRTGGAGTFNAMLITKEY